MSDAKDDDSQGMGYLDTARTRWVTVYAPLGVFVFPQTAV